MNLISPDPIYRAITCLLSEIERISIVDPTETETSTPLPAERLERLAKALSVKLKVLSEIEALNCKVEDQNKSQKYLNYEDLPPPSPEDRKRIIAKIRLLYDRVNAGEEIPDFDAGTSETS